MGTKRILVLGSSGRVGRLLRLAWAQTPPPGIELIFQSRGDIGIQWQLGQPACFGQVDAVIALWGVVQGDALPLNTELALAAQAIGQESGAKRVLHCSSVAVYAPKEGLLSEEDAAAATNPYGQAKLEMEQAVKEAAGPQAVCMRIGSVAGAESLAASMRRVWNGAAETLTLDQFPNQKGPARSYIGPSDLAQTVIALATLKDVPQLINVGGTAPVFMEDLLKAAKHPMNWRDAHAQARQFAVMDCSRLAKLVDLPQAVSDPSHIMGDWLNLEGRA